MATQLRVSDLHPIAGAEAPVEDLASISDDLDRSVEHLTRASTIT